MKDEKTDEPKRALEETGADTADDALGREQQLLELKLGWAREVGFKEGFRAGVEKAIQEMRLQRQREVIAAFFRIRFGSLSVEVRQRLDRAEESDLFRLVERIATASTPEDALELP